MDATLNKRAQYYNFLLMDEWEKGSPFWNYTWIFIWNVKLIIDVLSNIKILKYMSRSEKGSFIIG